MTYREIALEAYRKACANLRRQRALGLIDDLEWNIRRWNIDSAYAKRDEMASKLGAY